MTNEHYLIVSYFFFGVLSLCVGVFAHRVLRNPFAAIAERVAGKAPGVFLRRTLAASITLAAVLGFLSVNYEACKTYEQVVSDREYLVQVNREQLQHAGNWTSGVVLAWGLVVVIGLVVMRKKNSADEPKD
jgi:hypothetical protein